MTKLDLKKELKQFYNPSAKEVSTVNIPKMTFLMIDGFGDPNTSQLFKEAIEALYSLSYTLKFMAKKGQIGVDYAVMPLEGLWWAKEMDSFIEERSQWQWTLMIAQPDFITEKMVQEAKESVSKKKRDLPALSKVRFETYEEGEAVQIMHIGPFSAEGPAVAKLHEFIEVNNLELSGKHHEIYLSDFNKTAPEKLRTIIRQPFQAK